MPTSPVSTDTESITALPLEFLGLLAKGDVDGACDLLAPDVEYINVSLPTIRGRERVRAALGRMMARKGAGFEVITHVAAADGDTVLTDRTDIIILGPVRVEFWVYGRFVIRDGQIAVWRDSFDWMNITVAVVRGVLRAIAKR
jgi:limonene-1,2-epoxide hydrolase